MTPCSQTTQHTAYDKLAPPQLIGSSSVRHLVSETPGFADQRVPVCCGGQAAPELADDATPPRTADDTLAPPQLIGSSTDQVLCSTPLDVSTVQSSKNLKLLNEHNT